LFGVGFALGELNIGFDIIPERGQPFIGGNLGLDALALAKDGLRFFGIAPKIGIGGALFEGLQASAVLFTVKDNSAPARCAVSGRHIGAAGLQESWSVVKPFRNGPYFAFRNVNINRIAETAAHIQANQSPKRV
jgi:hypothetical protein